MRRLITLPARRLWTLLAAVCVLALGAGIAQAALSSGGPKPPAKPLDRAIRAAVTAPAAPGISARIAFANHLLPSGSVGGQGQGSPLLQGATGRLWLTRDGRFRLELQSQSGDAQIVSDGKQVSLYDASSNTVYKAQLPARKSSAGTDSGPPTLAAIRKGLNRLAQTWTLSGARPTNTAGQPSYTVRIAPKDDGGLLGAAEVAWDAAHGTPLRAAIYAQGQSTPVISLKATQIAYHSIPASDVAVSAPAGAKVVTLDPGHAAAARKGMHARQPDVSGAKAVSRRLGFPLAAPAKLAGLPRKEVRLVALGQTNGALVTYGRGLGAIVVFQHKAEPAGAAKAKGARARDSAAQLPSVNVDGATGKELATALGTVVTFDRSGVSYAVAGSVPPVAAENAARGLR
jgi:outer membrane lipoprotein-sorting protein